MRIGVDAGGTFTDFVVLHDDGRMETFKLRSHPREPAKVILAGLERAGGMAYRRMSSTVPRSRPTRCSNAKVRARPS